MVGEVTLGDLDRGTRRDRQRPGARMTRSVSLGGLMTQRIPRFDELRVPGLAASSTTNVEGHDQLRGRSAFASKLL
jgi:hypothetical protein